MATGWNSTVGRLKVYSTIWRLAFSFKFRVIYPYYAPSSCDNKYQKTLSGEYKYDDGR